LKKSEPTDSIRIEISEVYATGFNGGAFKIMGNTCTDPAKDAAKEDDKLKKQFGVNSGPKKKSLTCDDKFSDKFVGVKADES